MVGSVEPKDDDLLIISAEDTLSSALSKLKQDLDLIKNDTDFIDLLFSDKDFVEDSIRDIQERLTAYFEFKFLTFP